MTDALALAEKLLSLLEQSARSSTYKSALLLALIDRAQEYVDDEHVPVRSLAERVIELYWPQTIEYPATGEVLRQNQAGPQASIVAAIIAFRARHGAQSRVLPVTVREAEDWPRLVYRVEETLAEWPIPRLQLPYLPFLYSFDWPWQEDGNWSSRRYRAGSRAVTLFPGVSEGLVALGPLLRPFITRWWTDKAAQLNPTVPAARSVLDFEEFLFGRDRHALARIASGLVDFQSGRCFYCRMPIRAQRDVDHFVPWSYSGDDGLDNLVAACRRCNNRKRATLPAAPHLADLIERNRTRDCDLESLARKRHWPRDRQRSKSITRTAYLHSPDERPLWLCTKEGDSFTTLGPHRAEIERLLM